MVHFKLYRKPIVCFSLLLIIPMLMLPLCGVSMSFNPTVYSSLNPADITVKGKVTDETGEGLPGVNILVKGTANGTTTDAKGEFVLNAPEDGVLVFSFIGYSTQEIP